MGVWNTKSKWEIVKRSMSLRTAVLLCQFGEIWNNVTNKDWKYAVKADKIYYKQIDNIYKKGIEQIC